MSDKRNRFLFGMTDTELDALAAVINDPRFDEPKQESRAMAEAAERAWARGGAR